MNAASHPGPSDPSSLIVQWAQSEPSQSLQSPAEELMAEHALMRQVLAAMEAEAQRLATGASLQLEFWSDAVDFIGNFVHRCHRAKEERGCFDVLEERGVRPGTAFEALRKEHKKAESMTLELCEALETGDWESAMRLVHLYLHAMRGHMDREEREVFPLLAEADRSQAGPALRESLSTLEASALAGRGRSHYAEVASRLVRQAQVAKAEG